MRDELSYEQFEAGDPFLGPGIDITGEFGEPQQRAVTSTGYVIYAGDRDRPGEQLDAIVDQVLDAAPPLSSHYFGRDVRRLEGGEAKDLVRGYLDRALSGSNDVARFSLEQELLRAGDRNALDHQGAVTLRRIASDAIVAEVPDKHLIGAETVVYGNQRLTAELRHVERRLGLGRQVTGVATRRLFDTYPLRMSDGVGRYFLFPASVVDGNDKVDIFALDRDRGLGPKIMNDSWIKPFSYPYEHRFRYNTGSGDVVVGGYTVVADEVRKKRFSRDPEHYRDSVQTDINDINGLLQGDVGSDRRARLQEELSALEGVLKLGDTELAKQIESDFSNDPEERESDRQRGEAEEAKKIDRLRELDDVSVVEIPYANHPRLISITAAFHEGLVAVVRERDDTDKYSPDSGSTYRQYLDSLNDM